MTQAKDRVIKQLRGELADMAKERNEVQAELDECASMNTRLNKTLAKEREKIVTLKDVARFFRAQRDRVDAYLSATLDGIDRDKPPQYADDYSTTLGVGGVSAATVANILKDRQDRRPPVQEPDAHSGDDGRGHTMYRDHEPSRGWESL